jgi:hypothetical protein
MLLPRAVLGAQREGMPLPRPLGKAVHALTLARG